MLCRLDPAAAGTPCRRTLGRRVGSATSTVRQVLKKRDDAAQTGLLGDPTRRRTPNLRRTWKRSIGNSMHGRMIAALQGRLYG